MKLNFIPVKTRVVMPPKDEIWDILDSLRIQNGDIIFITSKILAIHQGRAVPIKNNDKLDLIKKESSKYLPYTHPSGFNVNLTITDNILIPASGIDESNANDHYILWPKNVDELCSEIRSYLIQKHKVKDLGVISTDSHTTPLRLGVTGITTGLSGIIPLRNIIGDKDIFGREMHFTKVNEIDPLTSMAVLIMGESAEQTPIVILRGYKDIVFDKNGSTKDFKIPPEEDIYNPLLSVFK
ncbi:coenzyme F420-0:L-glutamate ligase [Ruminococcaceae bacterium OttesenSCG-928-A11]|nr:coenzyme F420-0:L-glutamate ligase [Ruminococcaceae bacterium OttesenSCG-928-A11]